MTDEELIAIKLRVEAATPGPWHAYRPQVNVRIMAGDRYVLEHTYGVRNTADGEFIANARTDIPALLAEVDRLRAMLAWCDEHMPETVPPLPDFSGPDLAWQERRLELRALVRQTETPKAG